MNTCSWHICAMLWAGDRARGQEEVSVTIKGPHGMLGRAEGTWKSLTWILCEGGIKAKISEEEGLGWE